MGARVNAFTDVVTLGTEALSRAIAEGGFVALPLMGIALALAFALGERAFLLRRGTRLPLAALLKTQALDEKKVAIPSALTVAVSCLLRAHAFHAHEPHARRANALRLALAPLDDMLHRHAVLVRTLVVIAPLLGLLGTVSGMIETFDSLASMTLHTGGNGGVAGGISEALVSTELGLLVAIPGLLIGRLLDRTERSRKDELMALADLAIEQGTAPAPTGGV